MTLNDVVNSIRGGPSAPAPSASPTAKPAPIAPQLASMDEFKGATRISHIVTYVAGQAVTLPQAGLYLSYVILTPGPAAWTWTYDGTSTAVFPALQNRTTIWRLGQNNQVGNLIPSQSTGVLGTPTVYLVFTTVPLTAPGPSAYRGTAVYGSLAAGSNQLTFNFAGIQSSPRAASICGNAAYELVLNWPVLGSLVPGWAWNNYYGTTDGLISAAPPYQPSSGITVTINNTGPTAQDALVVIWY